MNVPSPQDDPLRIAERAAAAPYLDYPRLPRWYPLVAGAWFAALFGIGVGDWPNNRAIRIALLLLLVVAFGVAVRSYRARRGVEPSHRPRDAPPEIATEMRHYAVGATVALVAIFACVVWAPTAVTVPVTFVVAAGGFALYEHRYERAAQRVRERLS